MTMQTIRQFIKFILVGLLNLAVDFVIYWILTRVLTFDQVLAKAIASLVAIGNSYIWNRSWTFQAAGQAGLPWQLVKFILVQVTGAGAAAGVLAIFFRLFQVSEPISYLMAVFAGSLWNFSFNKGWVFRA